MRTALKKKANLISLGKLYEMFRHSFWENLTKQTFDYDKEKKIITYPKNTSRKIGHFPLKSFPLNKQTSELEIVPYSVKEDDRQRHCEY